MKLFKVLRLTAFLSMLFLINLIGCGVNTNEKTDSKMNNNLAEYELDNYKNNIDELSKTNILKDGEKVRIGISMDSLKEPVWKTTKKLLVEKSEALGAEVLVEQANSDDNVQLSQIDKLIAEGVNVLIIVPHDGEICAQAVQKAHAAGIKVIAYDRLIKNSDVDLYVAIDNYKVGQFQAEEMMKNVKSGNIAYVGGSPTDNNAVLFRQGAMDTLERNADINIVMDEYTEEWKSEIAYDNVLKFLNTSTDVQGIVCANDGTATGAISALKKFNMDGKIPVTGLDSELVACQRIVEGTQLMTVYKPAEPLAQATADAAIKFAKGEKVNTNNVTNNGKINVPSCLLDPVAVTKDNIMDTVIKDNYHGYDEVYENVPENERPKKQ